LPSCLNQKLLFVVFFKHMFFTVWTGTLFSPQTHRTLDMPVILRTLVSTFFTARVFFATCTKWKNVSLPLQVANCFFTAAYSLYLSAVIKKASAVQHDKKQLNELSMVRLDVLATMKPSQLLVEHVAM
jgi:hypothetical protein